MRAKPAAPSRELRKLWVEWIKLHKELDKKMPDLLAAPFFSACAAEKCERRVLLVGKATKDNWEHGYSKSLDESVDDAIDNRLLQNVELVQRKGIWRPGARRSAFWNLFCRLADFNTEFGLDSVIWSNVAKIGSRKDNPRGDLLSCQADLAERTLRAEIKVYRPVLTIFVTGSHAGLSEIINRALGVSNSDWQKSDEVDADSKVSDVWWMQGRPAALWTRHPQGARKKEVRYWLAKAQELIDS